ncbi:uncharacterized protein KD926_009056 [Aspergillus affinis]|uniref:uncharacterized protein n=1 Tax=Aspergillus affinis TaxID=1070780 RepID=UPI0022FDEDE5|nr:uncharacterized protein KD926_009056 [Aspergillus affinis]KAI9039837.1 hypothetical protein KD926_009056 [Aspergillus affinis]
MLPRFLSLTALALGLAAATMAQSLPHRDIIEQATIAQPSPHAVILPCAKCAFSEDPKCSEVVDRDSYLTITFATENNTLFANQDVVLPSSLPMEFSAIRHTGSGLDEKVRLSYALDAKPIPREPTALLGEVYLLKLKLLDAFGRLASDHVVMVGLTTTTTTSGSGSGVGAESKSLTITELTTSPLPPPPHHHHHPRPHPYDNINTPQSWLHAIKTTTKEYIHLLVYSYPPPPKHHHHYQYPSKSTDNVKDPHRTIPPTGTHPHHDYRSHHPSWHGHGLNRNFGRLVKPVLLPAVFGAAAGVMTCVVGFVVGRVVVAVYRCVRGGLAKRRSKGEGIGMAMRMGMDMGNGRMVRVPVVLRDCDGNWNEDGDEVERESLLREYVIKDEDVRWRV